MKTETVETPKGIGKEVLHIADVSFSLRDKFAIAAMNGELAAQNFETEEHWANEAGLAERAYLIADAMIKARSNES